MVTEQCPPDKVPQVIIPSLSYVGRLGSEVRVSASFQKNFRPGSVLRQQKGGGYDLGGFVPPGG